MNAADIIARILMREFKDMSEGRALDMAFKIVKALEVAEYEIKDVHKGNRAY